MSESSVEEKIVSLFERSFPCTIKTFLLNHIEKYSYSTFPIATVVPKSLHEPISKMWIRVQGKARGGSKAEHTR
jgi:hypothetical protein